MGYPADHVMSSEPSKPRRGVGVTSSPSLPPSTSSSPSSSLSPRRPRSLFDCCDSSIPTPSRRNGLVRCSPPPSFPPRVLSPWSTFLVLVVCWCCLGPVAWAQTTDNRDAMQCASKDFSSPTVGKQESGKDGICFSYHIMYDLDNLRWLENCTIIEGSLQLALLDISQAMKNYSFPKLREITGSLIMYRVFGLRSLHVLFPNLVVIRGQKLFHELYSLVLHENPDLEEIGLNSLASITAGAVRVTKNFKLCYLSSVDWARLATGVSFKKHVFMKNRDDRFCPNMCNSSCANTTLNGISRQRCWSVGAEGCQQNLACKCADGQPCMPDGRCCHKFCLGGCSAPGLASACYACKNVTYRNECLPSCPHGTYEISEYHCLTDYECLRMNFSSHEDSPEGHPMLLEGNENHPSQCVHKCPVGYMEVVQGNVNRCISCGEDCETVCGFSNSEIVSVEDSVKYKDCVIVEGSLQIKITDGRDLDRILTENLGSIKEVTGFVSIMGSYSMLTLHFFQSLEKIGGHNLVHSNYSLLVMDNLNLETLFPEEQMSKMRIERGAVAIFNNRRLCDHKIKAFLNSAGIIANMSVVEANGDLIPCQAGTVNLYLHVSADLVLVNLIIDQLPDERNILNWNIYYRKVKDPVRDTYEGRDACFDNEWSTRQIDSPAVPVFISQLEPFSKYAMYAVSYSLPRAVEMFRSPVIYFETPASQPSEPVDLVASSDSPTELTLEWEPPKKLNGFVTHYKVFYTVQPLDKQAFQSRDYCQNPIIKDSHLESLKREKKQNQTQEAKAAAQGPDEAAMECCKCPKTPEELALEERERQKEISFENRLHERVFTKRWSFTCVGKSNNIGAGLPEPDLVISNTNTSEAKDPMNEYVNVNFMGPFTMNHQVLSSTKDGRDFNDPILANDSQGMLGLDTLANVKKTLSAGDSTKNGTPSSWGNGTTQPSTTMVPEVMVYQPKVILTGLKHYQDYNIEVLACHDNDPNNPQRAPLCSDPAITLTHTKQREFADNINITSVEVTILSNKTGAVHIKWESPQDPNGIILKYNIQYRRLDPLRLTQAITECVSHRTYLNSTMGFSLYGLSPGNYSFRLNAHSFAGNGSFTPSMFFTIHKVESQNEDDTERIILIIFLILALLVFLLFLMAVFLVRKRKLARQGSIIVSPNPYYIPTDELYAPDEWEVPRDTIKLIKELGQGSFGKVFEGIMENPITKLKMNVAVKTVNDKADFQETLKILKEATTMKIFECHHVVKLLGVVSKGQPALVAMELMALGDLRTYLRRCREDEEDYPDMHPPTDNQIRQMAGEIADGMAYLADRKIVHRDLAARNCLVGEDLTVKVADFGMARDVYATEYYRKDHKALLPVRWMAPESLNDGIFTTMSDIWSYGVVLWEMVTLAEQPYQGLANDEVLKYVTRGQVMSAPDGCPLDLYSMMKKCWAFKPRHRPTFKNQIEMLVPYLGARFQEVSYFFQEVAKAEEEEEEEEEEGEEGEESECEACYRDKDENDEDDDPEDARQEHNSRMNRWLEDGMDGGKMAVGVSGEEDSLMTGGSPGFSANSSEEEEEADGESRGLHDGSHSPYRMQSSDKRKPRVSSGLQDSALHQAERSPLLLHQGGIQEPSLYPAPISSHRDPVFVDFDSIDVDDSDDYTQHYVKPEDRLSSERLKLLPREAPPSNPPAQKSPRSSHMSNSLRAKPGQSVGEDYTVMSPGQAASSPQGLDKVDSPSLVVGEGRGEHQPPPFQPAPPVALPTKPPSPSSPKPILQVDMQGLKANTTTTTTNPANNTYNPSTSHHPAHQKGHKTSSSTSPFPDLPQPSGKGLNAVGGDGMWNAVFPVHPSGDNNWGRKGGHRVPTGCDSASDSTSGPSGSEGGSKDSCSSAGSGHHRFNNSGAPNGHGPFSHQQAALC